MNKHKYFNDMAWAMHHAGIQLVPCIPGTKRPMTKWSQYNKGILEDGEHTGILLKNTDSDIQQWLDDGVTAFLMVMGEASGNLENLDFDAMSDGKTYYSDLLKNSAVEAILSGVTPVKSGKGWHNLYYKEVATPKKKLAYQFDTIDGEQQLQVIVEALCQGQISMMPYSLHPSGRYYLPEGEPHPADFVASIPTISEEDLQTVYVAAMALDGTGRYSVADTVTKVFDTATPVRNEAYGNGRYSAIYEYNSTHDIVEILEYTGHRCIKVTANRAEYAPPKGSKKSIDVDLYKNIAIVYGANHPLYEKASKNKGVITPYDLYLHYQHGDNAKTALSDISGPMERVAVDDWSKAEAVYGGKIPSLLKREYLHLKETKYEWRRAEGNTYDNQAVLEEALQILGETDETEVAPEEKDYSRGNVLSLLNRKSSIEWVAKFWLAIAEVIIIFGESNIGKTFVTMDVVMALVLGKNLFNNFRVKGPFKVVYFASEGQQDFPLRVKAAMQKYDLSMEEMELIKNNFYYDFCTFDFGNTRQLEEIIRYYKEMELEKVIFVFDTYINFLTDGDSTSDPAAIAANKAMRRLNAEFGGSCIVVHHPVKNNQGAAKVKLKGSGYHVANADRVDELSLVKQHDNGNATISLSCVKARAYNFHEDIIGDRLATGLGEVDEDGEIITSCFMDWDSEPLPDTPKVEAESKPKTVRLSILEYGKTKEQFTIDEVFQWNPLGKSLKTFKNTIADMVAKGEAITVKNNGNLYQLKKG